MASNRVDDVGGIRGLSLLRGAADAELVERIVAGIRGTVWTPWKNTKGRPLPAGAVSPYPWSRQDFGAEYNINTRGVGDAAPIPAEMRALFPALRAAGWTGEDPGQVIVTRYPSGGKLGAHIDSAVFGPCIAGLSIGAEWPINYSIRKGDEIAIPLPVLSVYTMQGPAREDWFHQIPPTHAGERISLTFRTVLPESPEPPARGRGAAERRPKAPQWRPGR